MTKINVNQPTPPETVSGLDRTDRPGLSLQESLPNLTQLGLNLEAMIHAASKSSELTSQLYQKSRLENSKKTKKQECAQRSKNEDDDDDDSSQSDNPETMQGPASLMRKRSKKKFGNTG